MIPLAALAIYLGGWWFFFALAGVIGLAAYEFYCLMWEGGYRPAVPLGIGLSLSLLLSARFPSLPLTAPIITATLIFSLIWHVIAYERGSERPTTDWALTLAGGLYLGWMGSLLIRLRDLPGGLNWVLLAFLPVWIADSAAYFVGRKWGTHKCCPRLSPKKSWEGTVAGWMAAILSTTVIGVVFGLAVLPAAALGVLLAVFTPLGDLAESMFKRQVGIKDSSHLIPGHGGVLDRIDSLLFSIPIVYYFIVLALGLTLLP